MHIGPRYKKARYLGAPVFSKTQTQKYAMRSQKKGRNKQQRGGRSEYGRQMLEKQKARYSYGVSSGQFGNYAKRAVETSGDNARILLKILESRIDNVVLRAGFATSRSAARQMVSHRHIMLNNKVITVPSIEVKVGDIISIRSGSRQKPLFAKLDEYLKNSQTPAWMKVNLETKEVSIVGEPKAEQNEALFDVNAVLEFYTR